MLVEISRTSGEPVEGATQIKATRYLYRRSDYIERNPAAMEDFQKLCTDIEKLPNGLYRGKSIRPSFIYVLEIPDIYEYVKEVGECIVSNGPDYVEGYPSVEIYDDYRE